MSPAALPGEDLVRTGLDDLARGVESIESLLVSIGAPRLRGLGYDVSSPFTDPEHHLYHLLSRSDPDSAHSRYNALIRRLVGFERAAACVKVADGERIRAFMRALGAAADADTRIYFTGGATAVLEGWRETTIDVDIRVVPDRDVVFRAIALLKERLNLNVELPSPSNFIPVRTDWVERSRYIGREGRVSFYHFDLYAQALAKVERGHAQDLHDVREMIARGLVEPARALEYFEAIEPELYRYPALDPASFRQAVERAFPPHH